MGDAGRGRMKAGLVKQRRRTRRRWEGGSAPWKRGTKALAWWTIITSWTELERVMFREAGGLHGGWYGMRRVIV